MPPIVIDEDSPVPKYKQLIAALTKAIKTGEFAQNQQLPSINELAEELYIARDTIEKAYHELKEQGLILSVRGKGYFVKEAGTKKLRIVLILNKLSAYKKRIYYAFLNTLGDAAVVDLYIHHSNGLLFREIWEQSKGKYHYYVLMPHFYENNDPAVVRALLEEIPKHQLVLLDRDIEGLSGEYLAVYQDFEKDIYRCLEANDDLLEKYQEMVLVFPTDGLYPPEIIRGFRFYCVNYHKQYRIIESMFQERVPRVGTAYLVVEESDLAELIKKVRRQAQVLGKEVGVLSFNDTTLKEVLADGITVITTDFETMGRTAAALLLDGKKIKIKNPFSMIRRNSL